MVFHTLVIGSGIAGLTVALRIAEFGKVLILTKNQLLSGSTPMAQGGIAIVTDQMHDSFESHMEDTLKAGGYENDRKAVEMLVYTAPTVLQDLENWGIHFHSVRHKEGGHAVPRILNVGDKTGKSIAEHLIKKVLAHKNITVVENFYATDLIMKNGEVRGVIGIPTDLTPNTIPEQRCFCADFTIIATGGACALFATATVPLNAIGDGIAMAIRAGACTKDLYRIQFHPTALDAPGTPKFLLSEALRGEGAFIINSTGERFVDELLPRDQVSKAIFEERKKGPVFLDVRHVKDFPKKFPKIYETLLEKFEYHPQKDVLPIAPAAHYFGGGISVNTDGETSIPRLFATGECTYTGVHGRNRLASNSLLEGLVYSKRIAEKIALKTVPSFTDDCPPPNLQKDCNPLYDADDDDFLKEVRNRMDEDFGIVRKKECIQKNLQWIKGENPKSIFAKNMKIVATAMWEEGLVSITVSK